MSLHGSRTSAYLHGGDPAPGDDAQIRTVIGIFTTTTDRVSDALTVLDGIGRDTSMWTGVAATAFQGIVGDLRSRLVSAHSAYGEAADALRGWLRKLENSQADAVRVAASANEIGPHAANSGVFPLVQPPELHSLQSRFNGIAEQARRDAQECAKLLAEAIDAVKKYEKSLWDTIVDKIDDVKKFIDEASSLLGVAAVLLAFIPGAGEIALGILIVLAVASEACSVVLYANNRESLGDLLGDTFWNGVTLATPGLKAVGAGARSAEALSAGEKGAGATAKAMATRAGHASGAHAEELIGKQHMYEARADNFQDAAAGAKDRVTHWFRHGYGDLLHPIQAGQAEKETADLVKLAQQSRSLTPLDSWLPAGHRVGSGSDVLFEGLGVGHDGFKVGESIGHKLELAPPEGTR